MVLRAGSPRGKTFFTGFLATHHPSLRRFDSDARARELTTSDPAILEAVREEFGAEVFDAQGVLRARGAPGHCFFADPARRKALEAILHPAIRSGWLELAKEIREQPGSPWLAVDIPLLFETGAESYFDKIVTVACDPLTQRRRLIEQRNLSPLLAEQLIGAQLPLAVKAERADFVVWNDGLPEALDLQARTLSRHLFS